MPLSPGDMISDSLILEREIGKGGMGSVWIAKHSALGSHVAVKILRSPGGDVSAEARRRFEAEARGLAQLDHPNLVRIFDFGMSPDGDPFIVMELLRGEDLAQRLARGRLDLETTANILRQTCKALGRAHEAGVIHRDIKPANIFLLEADGELVVKVLDFGVARFGDSALDMTTKTGALIGTPFFMSPEQHMNPKGIDHRADLWSVAVVAFACLTAELPFKGETITSLGVAVLNGQRASVRSLRPELPAAIDIWMDRALARDPSARYPSARELAESFDRARVAVSPMHPSAAAPADSALREPSHSSAAIAAPSRAAPVGPEPMMPTTAATPARGGSSSRVLVGGVIATLLLGAGGVGGWLVFGRDSASRAPDKSNATSKHSSTSDDAKTTADPTSTAARDAPATSTAQASDSSVAPKPNATSTAEPVGKPPTPSASSPSNPKVTATTQATTTAAVSTSAPAAATRSAAPANGVLASCWRGNAEKGTPASSATATFHVDTNGKTSTIVIGGPARSVSGFTACCVTGIASLAYGPGADETVAASAGFSAVK